MSILDTTDQIFSTLVVHHGRQNICMTVEQTTRCHDGSYVVEGHSVKTGRPTAFLSVPATALEHGVFFI